MRKAKGADEQKFVSCRRLHPRKEASARLDNKGRPCAVPRRFPVLAGNGPLPIPAMHLYRTHNCGALRKDDVGKTVRISGWVHRVRDHGGLLFIDLRDHYGLTQVVADPKSPAFAL